MQQRRCSHTSSPSIAGPIDPTHTIRESELASHVVVCPRARERASEAAQPFIRADANAGSDAESDVGEGPFAPGRGAARARRVQAMSADEFQGAVDRAEAAHAAAVALLGAPCRRVLRPAVCEPFLRPERNRTFDAKHAVQQASIFGHLCAAGLLPCNSNAGSGAVGSSSAVGDNGADGGSGSGGAAGTSSLVAGGAVSNAAGAAANHSSVSSAAAPGVAGAGGSGGGVAGTGSSAADAGTGGGSISASGGGLGASGSSGSSAAAAAGGGPVLLEMGAGKGFLSGMIADCCAALAGVVLADIKSNFRSKADTALRRAGRCVTRIKVRVIATAIVLARFHNQFWHNATARGPLCTTGLEIAQLLSQVLTGGLA